MNIIENIQHDLLDANFSLSTAIELLTSIEQDSGRQDQALQALIAQLNNIKCELDNACENVIHIQSQR